MELQTKLDLALARYQRAEKDAGAEHSYGDDARLRQAEEQLDLGNQEAVSELLSTLPTDYPKGDVKGEATWRLAWRDYKDGRYQQAIGWLKKQIALVPIDDNYFAEGQAQYWIGRSYDRLKKPKEAQAAYTETWGAAIQYRAPFQEPGLVVRQVRIGDADFGNGTIGELHELDVGASTD